jgi:hypothetical protein
MLFLFLALHALAATASNPTKLAAISLLPATPPPPDGLRLSIGTPVKHRGNPLFVQDRPWETRIDNGYPNVVPPNDDYPHGFQVWYGNQATNGSRNRYSLLYANSTDGIHWEKPNLGIFDFGAAGFPNFAHLGTANNIIVEGDGIGIFYDPHDPDPARRYKALGDACWLSPTLAFNGGTCDNLYLSPPPPVAPYKRPQFYGLSAASADGLTWPREQLVNISWPPPQKWDTHNNVFFDDAGQTYVATTRSVPVEPTGLERETSLTRSVGPHFVFDTSKEAPPVIMRGNISHQTYAQVTFPWLNMYLGLVMVFDQDTGDQVHCRLTQALKPEGPWRPVEGDNIVDAPDFLPLGAASGGAFDSHVIFAAARPFRHDDTGDEWMYYMGGNGPHDGARESAFGLATLRPDGFACVRGQGTFTTPAIVVTDAVLTATVDFGPGVGGDGGGGGKGALRIGVLLDGATGDEAQAITTALSLASSVPLTANVTDGAMRWHGDDDHNALLATLVGKTIRLEVRMEGDALLYAIGFGGAGST